MLLIEYGGLHELKMVTRILKQYKLLAKDSEEVWRSLIVVGEFDSSEVRSEMTGMRGEVAFIFFIFIFF